MQRLIEHLKDTNIIVPAITGVFSVLLTILVVQNRNDTKVIHDQLDRIEAILSSFTSDRYTRGDANRDEILRTESTRVLKDQLIELNERLKKLEEQRK